MNNINEFRDALAAHLLSKHAATDEQTSEKTVVLADMVALHEQAHRDGVRDHFSDSLEEGPLTKAFIFDLPVQVFGHSPEDAWRRFYKSGLSDGDATIKQGSVAVPVVYINVELLDAEGFKFGYDYPLNEQPRKS